MIDTRGDLYWARHWVGCVKQGVDAGSQFVLCCQPMTYKNQWGYHRGSLTFTTCHVYLNKRGNLRAVQTGNERHNRAGQVKTLRTTYGGLVKNAVWWQCLWQLRVGRDTRVTGLDTGTYCGISRIREGEFSRFTIFSDIREGINLWSVVVREVTDQWPVWVSARCQRCEIRRAWSNTGARRLPAEPGGS